MFWRAKRSSDLLDPKYVPLATYNAEVARGIVHTEDWKKKMFDLEMDYSREAAEFSMSLLRKGASK
jgi:hypothetical protein